MPSHDQHQPPAPPASSHCPVAASLPSPSMREDFTVVVLLGSVMLMAAIIALLSLQGNAAQMNVVIGALGMLLLAEGVLLRLWWRMKRRLKERDEALDELCRVRRQAAQAAAERARMMAFITHELRTPLNGVLGMAQLLRGTRLTPEQVNYVQAIDSSGRLLLSMVNELLETARAEATGAADVHTPLAKRPFKPARMVEEVCELLSPRAHARGLELACFVHPDVRGTWLGDEARIRQILLNLLGNALKFTHEGGVMVRLEPEEKGLRLSVEDTGPGVPKELEAHIFRPFARVGAHDAAREGGVGLGLAIVRQLLDMMGGRMTLRNRPGKGATFEVFLPLKPAVPRQKQRKQSTRPLEGMEVALMVPEGMHRRVLSDYVRALGGTVRLAQPEDFTRLAERGCAHVIVDAAHADALRQWLRGADGHRPRVWLLLTPEERLRLHELMQHPALAGYLLKPVRRRTIIERLAHAATEGMVNASVRALRDMAHQARQAGEHSKTAHKNASGSEQAAPLVLLAEDDPVNAQVARIVLKRAGFEVIHCDNGEQLLAEVRRRLLNAGERRPLCALVDVHMPVMDGVETAQAIRQLEHDLGAPSLPLIALTAGDEDSERERCLAAGMDGFLQKPLDMDALKYLLERFMPRAAAHHAASGAVLH